MKAKSSTKRRRAVGISVWVDDAEAALLGEVAALADDPVSAWMRKIVLRKARAEKARMAAREVSP